MIMRLISRTSGPTRHLALLLLATVVGGCAAPKPVVMVEDPGMSPAADASMPSDLLQREEMPNAAAAPVRKPEIKPIEGQVGAVRPGLNLRVSVLVAGQPEYNEPSRQVSSQGYLDVPLIGKVQVVGLSLQQIEQKLTDLYTQYLVGPQVVVEYVHLEGSSISPWGYVTVLGRVRSPGKIPIPATRDLTVSAAIQQVGGFDTSARSSSIRVTRQLPNDATERIKVDLKAYAKGDLDEDITLKAGDVIYVPESLW